ncbi:MAG: PEP-CTERM sorting domain-containing protein [Armatimonadetes bacterium]|nr:PEP-CTERM sorting domain-containing protein [Armatimonadota bacterium]
MTMARLLIAAGIICVLLLGSIPAADADAWVRWKDQSIQQGLEVVWIENLDPWSTERYAWQFGSDPYNPGYLINDTGGDFNTADFPQRLRVVGGGSGAWKEGAPLEPIYVRLVTRVKNVGTENWVDFHLRAISGCNIYTKYVSSNGTWSPAYWNWTGINTETGVSGWDYVMDPEALPPLGPDDGPVHPGETFSCETWIAVTSSTGDFEVELWPTVPEPSALLVLGMGASGLAAGILRRRRAR